VLLLGATAELVVVDRPALGDRNVPPAGLVGSRHRQVAVHADVDERRATAGQRALDGGANLVGSLGRLGVDPERATDRREVRRVRLSIAEEVRGGGAAEVRLLPALDADPAELSRTTVQTGEPSIATVASSCIVWRKSPSPQIASTWASGRASWAPMAAGSVKPIVLNPPEVMCVLGRRVTQRCLTIPCGSPAPVTTIASSRAAAWTSRTARAIVMGVASEPDFSSTCRSHSARSDAISSP